MRACPVRQAALLMLVRSDTPMHDSSCGFGTYCANEMRETGTGMDFLEPRQKRRQGSVAFATHRLGFLFDLALPVISGGVIL